MRIEKARNKAIFLDRDGVVIWSFRKYIKSPNDVIFVPGALNAISELSKFGAKIFIVSNQPGCAKDHFNEIEFEAMTEKVRFLMDIKLDGEYYCLHHPEGVVAEYTEVCECRKPKPGMLLKAAEDLDINLSQSWMIGDGITDIQAGAAAGCKTILIGRMKCDLCKLMEDEGVKPDFIAPNLLKASLIIQEQGRDK